jgi:hypothetical protein
MANNLCLGIGGNDGEKGKEGQKGKVSSQENGQKSEKVFKT